MRGRRGWSLVLVLAGLLLIAVPERAGAATTSDCEFSYGPPGTADVIPVAKHYDLLATFSSGRAVCAVTYLYYDFPNVKVLAAIDVFALAASGSGNSRIRAGIYELTDFEIRYAQCFGPGACGSGTVAGTKCTSGCRIETSGTGVQAVAKYRGSVWRDARSPYGDNTAWRVIGRKLHGVIINTTDSFPDRCVSSELFRAGNIGSIGGPSC
jgi:hypothetical protein